MKKQIVNIALFLAVLTALTQSAFANVPPRTVPDAGSASALLGLAVGGLAMLRRYVR